MPLPHVCLPPDLVNVVMDETFTDFLLCNIAVFDWKMAQEEVMQMADDPIQDAITRLEKQYEEDKQSALEKQRQEYEKHFQQLKSYMSPSTPYPPFVPYDPFLRIGSKMTPTTPTVMSRLEKWGQQR